MGRVGAVVASILFLVVSCTADATHPTAEPTETEPTEAEPREAEPMPELEAEATVWVGGEVHTFTLDGCGIGQESFFIGGIGATGRLRARHLSPPTDTVGEPAMSAFVLSGVVHAEWDWIRFGDYAPGERATGFYPGAPTHGDVNLHDPQFEIRCGAIVDGVATLPPASASPPRTGPPFDPPVAACPADEPPPRILPRRSVIDHLPADRPDRLAAIFNDAVILIEGDQVTPLDISAANTARLVDGSFVYSVTNGGWLWPPAPGTAVPTPGTASELVQPLFQFEGMPTRLWDVAAPGSRPTAILIRTDNTVDPPVKSLLAYDLETGEYRLLFDKATRRDGLTEDEREAIMYDAALGGDRLVVLFGGSERSWLEWYDLGRSADPRSAGAIGDSARESGRRSGREGCHGGPPPRRRDHRRPCG